MSEKSRSCDARGQKPANSRRIVVSTSVLGWRPLRWDAAGGTTFDHEVRILPMHEALGSFVWIHPQGHRCLEGFSSQTFAD